MEIGISSYLDCFLHPLWWTRIFWGVDICQEEGVDQCALTKSWFSCKPKTQKQQPIRHSAFHKLSQQTKYLQIVSNTRCHLYSNFGCGFGPRWAFWFVYAAEWFTANHSHNLSQNSCLPQTVFMHNAIAQSPPPPTTTTIQLSQFITVKSWFFFCLLTFSNSENLTFMIM